MKGRRVYALHRCIIARYRGRRHLTLFRGRSTHIVFPTFAFCMRWPLLQKETTHARLAAEPLAWTLASISENTPYSFGPLSFRLGRDEEFIHERPELDHKAMIGRRVVGIG